MIKFKLMKHLFLSVGLLCLMAAPISVSAQSQSTKDLRKERKELVKASKAELNAKATKAAQKEAKKLKKEGWQTAPGALPLEKQLDKSYLMQMEYDSSMYPKYLMGEAMSIGENYDGARPCHYEWVKLLSDQCRQYDVTFNFIETGTIFVKDGKTYRIPNKRIQSQQAFQSGLSYQGRKIPRMLRMPEGTLFGTDISSPEPFFRAHCSTCGSRMTCNGCSNYGACDAE